MADRFKMSAFFLYFGSKLKSIKHYPAPREKLIVEPFAGSATYSVYYYDRQIELYDLNPYVCSVWDYLIKVKESELDALPNDIDKCVSEYKIPQEAKNLIGFCMSLGGVDEPIDKPSAWMRSPDWEGRFWGRKWKDKLLRQIPLIRHWKVKNCSFRYVENKQATWFIDPPYYQPSLRTSYSSSTINFQLLAQWCRERQGQSIVCEQSGATWLPFKDLCRISTKTNLGNKSNQYFEAIWTNDQESGSQPIKRLQCPNSPSTPSLNQSQVRRLVKLKS